MAQELRSKATGNKEAVNRRCSVEKVFLKISQNLQENTCVRVPFFFFCKVAGLSLQLYKKRDSGLSLQLYKKETLAQAFSCEFCDIFKNTFSYRTPSVAASENNHIYIYLKI